MLISFSDLLVFSGLVVVSKDPAGHLLIFIHQHWMDSVMEAKTSLSCHDFFPSFTLLIIQRMFMSVLLAFMQCVAPMVAHTGTRIVVPV